MFGFWKKKTSLESGHVFRMRSVHDIFRKLGREKQRFEKAELNGEGRADQVDAAINFAITAWHVTDWVWGQHEQALREHFDVNDLRGFQNEMRRQCPDLAVCDVIANAAKHGGTAHERENRPEIETILVADSVTEGTAGVELIAAPARRQWSLEIEVDGTRVEPIELFNRIFRFWHKFIQQHCVAKQASRASQ